MFATAAFAEEPFAATQGIVKTGVSSLSANATQTTTGVHIASGSSEMTGIASQASVASGIMVGVPGNLSANLTQTTAALRIRPATTGTLSTNLTQSSTAVLIASGSSDIEFLVIQSTSGDIKFVEINAGETAETWTEITHTGDTWTEINAGSTAETWTEVVN
jgi:hypothetical protein